MVNLNNGGILLGKNDKKRGACVYVCYKPADRFINRRPVYKPVRFTISSQHIPNEY